MNLKKKKIISRYEIVVVNNGSVDQTEVLVEHYLHNHNYIKLINLTKNFGYNSSFIAGHFHSKNDMIITVTADLHEDVKVISKMIKLHYLNHKCVLSIYKNRDEGMLKNIFADLYYSFMNICGIKVIKRHNDFRLITQDINKRIFELNDKYIFLRVLILKLIKSYNLVYYNGNKRKGGKSKFNFLSSFELAFDSFAYYVNKFIINLAKNTIIFFLLAMILLSLPVQNLIKIEFENFLIPFILLLLSIINIHYINKRYFKLKSTENFFMVKNILSSKVLDE